LEKNQQVAHPGRLFSFGIDSGVAHPGRLFSFGIDSGVAHPGRLFSFPDKISRGPLRPARFG
jgi:hypothetical protein